MLLTSLPLALPPTDIMEVGGAKLRFKSPGSLKAALRWRDVRTEMYSRWMLGYTWTTDASAVCCRQSAPGIYLKARGGHCSRLYKAFSEGLL